MFPEKTIYSDSDLDIMCSNASKQVNQYLIRLNKEINDDEDFSRTEYLEFYLARQIEGYNLIRDSIEYNNDISN
jgi:ferritin